jgi:hypothetical protein
MPLPLPPELPLLLYSISTSATYAAAATTAGGTLTAHWHLGDDCTPGLARPRGTANYITPCWTTQNPAVLHSCLSFLQVDWDEDEEAPTGRTPPVFLPQLCALRCVQCGCSVMLQHSARLACCVTVACSTTSLYRCTALFVLCSVCG